MKINKLAFFISGLFSVLVITGCAGKIKKADDLSRIQGDWKIVMMTGYEVDQVPSATLNVVKDGNAWTLSGFSGVNSYFAVFTSDDKLPVGDSLASTKMMGNEEEMHFEDSLLYIIGASDSWKLQGKVLTISKGNKKAIFIKK